MPAEWWFYHIEHTALEAAIAPLLEKCLERRWRVVIAGEEETIRRLDAALWIVRDDSFIPHGLVGPNAAAQPVLLSTAAEPLNGARVALLLDGRDADPDRFDRCMVVFDGGDAPVRDVARKQYQAASSAGATTRYFQQADGGGWTEKPPARRE